MRGNLISILAIVSYSVFLFFFWLCTGTSVFFFFSSRRRHTRSDRDWSSDECSSDLKQKRSEEHTSELQSRSDLVCRLLLEIEEHTSVVHSRSDLVCRLLLHIKIRPRATQTEYN